MGVPSRSTTSLDSVLTSVLGGSVMGERHGSGVPQVLALHGWARSRADFKDVLAGFDGLALDLHGFGTTPAPPHAWTTSDYADALAPLLDELDRPVLLGHSFGARVAVHLAGSYPCKIGGMVLTGAPLIPLEASGARVAPGYRVVRRLHRVGLISDERMEAARRRYGSSDYRAAEGVMRDVLVKSVMETRQRGYDTAMTAAGTAGVPVRLVFGELDTAAPPYVAGAIAAATGAPAPILVSGSAHLLDADLTAALRLALTDLGVHKD
jgi:pimeloyl-ACP methyl ester carboxylesterase